MCEKFFTKYAILLSFTIKTFHFLAWLPLFSNWIFVQRRYDPIFRSWNVDKFSKRGGKEQTLPCVLILCMQDKGKAIFTALSLTNHTVSKYMIASTFWIGFTSDSKQSCCIIGWVIEIVHNSSHSGQLVSFVLIKEKINFIWKVNGLIKVLQDGRKIFLINLGSIEIKDFLRILSLR